MRLLVVLVFLLASVHSQAQCCSGGVPMAGNLGLPNATKGTWQFSLNYDFNNLQILKSGSLNLDDDSRARKTHSILLESGYSLTEKISIDVFLSFVRQEREVSTLIGLTDFTSTQGIGDGVVLAKYRITKALTGGYGIKLPLGASDQLSDNGIALNADLQPGSGAWDHIGYINYTLERVIRPSMTISGTITHRWRGVNNEYLGSSRYQFGNELVAILAVSDRFTLGSNVIDPSLRIRYRSAGRDEFNSFGFGSSGGEFLFMNPGLSVALNEKINWQLNAEFPLFSRVNETQLSPSLRLNTGFSLTISREEKIKL